MKICEAPKCGSRNSTPIILRKNSYSYFKSRVIAKQHKMTSNPKHSSILIEEGKFIIVAVSNFIKAPVLIMPFSVLTTDEKWKQF